ncbi:MAG: TonB-dependent receptor [Rhodospirillaceae bacterium]
MDSKAYLLSGAAGLALTFGLGEIAYAQSLALEEIVVTARKREESLQEVPLAISVFSADDIDRSGFKGLEELSLQVAGLQYSDQGGQRPGRFNPAIRFRGMNVNSNIPTFQLGALFVDGIYVLGSTHSIPLDDLERVEVIKGPQAAYFGRNTFGGAVNYITRNPSTEEFSGKIQASGATYDEFDVSGSFEGPLVEGKLAARVGARLYSRGGMWTASDGGELGQQSTNSVNATLFATPNEALSIRLRAFYGRDDDGAPAGGFIGGEENDTCTGKTITTKAGETANPVNWFCGAVPRQGEAISRLGNFQIIDGVTTLRPQIPFGAIETNPNFIIDNLINAPLPDVFSGVPSIDKIGLVRNTYRYSAALDYEFQNGMSAVVQGGYNKMEANWIREQGLTGLVRNFSNDPQTQDDISIEARLTSNQEDSLRWLVGLNYYEQDFATSGTGGSAVIPCWDALPGVPAESEDCRPIPTLVTSNGLNNIDSVKTSAVFAAVSYDVTDQFTVNLEGRYQQDRLDKAGVDIDANTFLPRVILQYQPFEDTNLYASYSKGVLPGESNAFLINADAQELVQYEAQLGNRVFDILPEEQLDSYEIGWKQTAFDSRLSFSTALYYGKWKNQKSRVVASIQETCKPFNANSTGCRPQDLTPLGDLQSLADGTPIFTARNTTITGTGDVYGLELEGQALLADGWTTDFSLAYAASEFTDFESNFEQTYANFIDMKGNEHARYPKWTGSISSTYTQPLNDDWDWFVRGDAIYFGKTWVSVANLAQCNDYWLFNARAGVERDDLRVELWVKNAFDDDNWSACARWTDFSRKIDFAFFTFYQGVAVTPQNKRQFGLKTSLSF